MPTTFTNVVNATITLELVIDEDSPAASPFHKRSSDERITIIDWFADKLKKTVIEKAPLTTWRWDSLRVRVDENFLLSRASVESKLSRQLEMLNDEIRKNGGKITFSRGLLDVAGLYPKLPKCATTPYISYKLNACDGKAGKKGKPVDWVEKHESGVTGYFAVFIQWEVPPKDGRNEENPKDWPKAKGHTVGDQ